MTAPTYRHASGDDKDGCISCWLEYDSEPVWGIPEGRACQTPQDDGEGYCALCGHTVEVREPVLPCVARYGPHVCDPNSGPGSDECWGPDGTVIAIANQDNHPAFAGPLARTDCE